MNKTVSLSLALLTVSCAELAVVHEGGESVAGIPFYVKTSVPHQVTEYEMSWYEVVLTGHVELTTSLVPEDGGQADYSTLSMGQPEVLSTIVSPGNEADLETLRTLATENRWEDLAQAIPPGRTVFDPEQAIRNGSAVRVRNETVTREFVDRSRVFYLNANMPWFGTANLNQTLNSDGTLGKTELGAESTPQALAELLPISEVILGALSEPMPPAEEVNALLDGQGLLDDKQVASASVKRKITLRIQPRRLRRVYSKDLAPDETPAALGPDTPGVNFRDAAVAVAPSKAAAPKGKAIEFAGSIRLPQDAPKQDVDK